MAVAAISISRSREESAVKGSRSFYAPELDILRFFAFSVVFARHVVTGFGIASTRVTMYASAAAISPSRDIRRPGFWQLMQGFAQSLDFGVCLFFFLSSFLITTLLLMEKESTGKVSVKGFYVRRVLRIWPLYFAFLGLMGILSFQLHWMNIDASRMLASALLIANWPIVVHGWAGSPIEPLWSVSVEEQFYALWPQFARFGRSAILVTSALLGVVPFLAISWIARQPHTENTMYWANSFVQCLFFSAGAITALRFRNRAPDLGRTKRRMMFIAGWICWMAASGVCHVVRTSSPDFPELVLGYCLILAGTVLLFFSFYGWRPGRLASRIVYLGKISYGLYVFHFFWLELLFRCFDGIAAGHREAIGMPGLIISHSLIALFAFFLTFLSASISYRFLERPFLRLKSKFTIVASRPA